MEQGGEQGGQESYLAWARCRRRSPIVSENSIFMTYICSPLSDLMRRVQTSGAEAPASSALSKLEVRKLSQLRSEGFGMLGSSEREKSFPSGKVLEMSKA